MIQRTITRVTVDTWHEPQGFVVQVTTIYCESTLARGSLERDVTRYDRLTEDECRDVLDMMADGPLPGEQHVVEMSLFTLA